jgi:hypothetical protein
MNLGYDLLQPGDDRRCAPIRGIVVGVAEPDVIGTEEDHHCLDARQLQGIAAEARHPWYAPAGSCETVLPTARVVAWWESSERVSCNALVDHCHLLICRQLGDALL